MTPKPSNEELEKRIRELHEREMYYRTLLESVNDAVLVHEIGFDGMPGKFIDANRVALNRLGYTHAELLKLTPKDITTENGYKDLSKARTNITSNCAAIFETIHLSRNGDLIPVESHVSVFELAGQRVAVSVARDLSERKRAEESFRKSEWFLRSTLDGLLSHIVVLDDRGEIILTNKAYRDFGERNGVEPGAVSEGTNYLAVCDTASAVHSQEAAPFAEGIREVLSGKLPSFELEYSCHSPEEKRWFVGRVTPIHDEGSRWVVIAHENISERKKAEEVQRESDQKWKNILVNTPQIGIALDTQASIVFANRRFLELTGWREDEIIGRNWFDLFIPEDVREKVRGVFDTVMHSKSTQDLSFFENEIVLKSGERRTIAWSNVLSMDASGAIVDVTCLGIDLTERKQDEELIAASEEKFRHAFMTSPDSININRMSDSRYIEVNDGFLRIMGYKREEVIGRTSLELNIWKNPEDRQALVKGLKADGYVENLSAQFCRADGTICEGLMSASVVELNGEQCILSITRDVTERKQAEIYREMGREILQILNEPGDLRESIQRVLTVLKARTGVDAVGLRLQEGEDFPYFVQDDFSKDFLLTENTLIQRDKDGGVCRDKDGNVRLECTCGLVISGKTDPSNPMFTQGGSSWTNDSFPSLDLPSDQDPRMQPRNNCIHQGYSSVALIPVRTSDRIVGLIQLNDKRKGRFTLEMIEVLEDIAAHVGSALIRKQMEDELVEYSQRLQHATDSGKLAVWDWNVKDNIMFWDDRMFEFYGISRDSFPSNVDAWMNGLHPDDKQRAVDECNAALLGEKEFDTTFRVLHPEGTIKYIKATALVTRDNNGKAIRMIGINTDITEQSELEAERKLLETQLNQAQKMESVGRLAGGVAHDFNNMLGVILGHTEMALDEIDPSSSLYANLHAVQQAAERSADLTRQLLAFARKQTIAPKVIDLNKTVKGMLKMLHRLIGEDINLLWQLGSNLRPVKIDPAQIDQILANLCVNARDAIAGVGKVTIETNAKTFDEDYCADHLGFLPGEYVLLEVSDNGCGMDKTTLNQIFEPFFTTKEQGKGTGLGLASVFGMVKQNNGFINVYSEPGKGTTFKVYLPAYTTKSNREVEKAPNLPTEQGNETILLVEDESAILEMTTMMLTRLGYTVVPAATPGEAIRLAHEYQGRIDLLMTDVVMPEMNGRELAGNLLSHYPDLKRLFMSGYTANVIAHHGVLDQGVHFIQKPFSKKDLGAKLREALED